MNEITLIENKIALCKTRLQSLQELHALAKARQHLLLRNTIATHFSYEFCQLLHESTTAEIILGNDGIIYTMTKKGHIAPASISLTLKQAESLIHSVGKFNTTLELMTENQIRYAENYELYDVGHFPSHDLFKKYVTFEEISPINLRRKTWQIFWNSWNDNDYVGLNDVMDQDEREEHGDLVSVEEYIASFRVNHAYLDADYRFIGLPFKIKQKHSNEWHLANYADALDGFLPEYFQNNIFSRFAALFRDNKQFLPLFMIIKTRHLVDYCKEMEEKARQLNPSFS